MLTHIAQETLPQFAVSYYFDAATFAIYAVGCLPIPLVELAVGHASLPPAGVAALGVAIVGALIGFAIARASRATAAA